MNAELCEMTQPVFIIKLAKKMIFGTETATDFYKRK